MISRIKKDLAAIGIDVGPAELGLFVRTHNSELYRLTSNRFPHDLVLKYILASSEAEAVQRAREEYASMLKIYGAGTDIPMGPMPYDILLDRGCLAMEYVPSDTLRSRLVDRHQDIETRMALMREAGALLKMFHDRFAVEARRYDSDRSLEPVDIAFAETLMSSAANRYRTLLAHTAGLVDDITLEVSASHGDCKPDNFLCADDGILMIDVLMRHTNYCCADVAYFLNSFLLVALEPKRLPLLRHRRRAEAAFLDGYGWGKTPDSTGQLAWFRLRSMLLLWTGSVNRGILKRLYFEGAHRVACALLKRELAAAKINDASVRSPR